MKNKFALGLAIASLTGFVSSYALANPTQIKLYDGIGSTTGGEFKADVTLGTSAAFQAPSVLYGVNTDFITFCLEKSETFTPGNTLYVKGAPNTGAMNGGSGSAAMYVGDVAGSASFDPISYKTAYLYTQFSAGTLSNYDYSNATLREADANALQNAFWYLENEQPATYTLSGQALAWVNEATAANWTNIGNVRVLNLYKDQAFTQIAQDQLYMTAPVPEPETYAMMLAGLGLIGFFGNRRRRKLV